MTWRDVKNLEPHDLRSYRAGHKENAYLLIDVRQPDEYTQAHIPGATLIPLGELEMQLETLPHDRDLVFYCRSGARSAAAAALTADAGQARGVVYNLAGGIMAWDGKVLADFPRVHVFDKSADHATQLYTAMDLEKGAWRFYQHVKTVAAAEPYAEVFKTLSKAEEGHARSVYRFWAPTQSDPPPFERLFDALSGDILEGGERLEDLLKRVAAMNAERCLDLMELAIDIEYTAFDLYRTVAEAADDDAQAAFLSIAQAEKGHMRVLAKALSLCTSQ